MSVDIDLAGKRVLVVGGSAGIGRSTALAAAAAGAAITVVGRSAEKLAEVVGTAGTGTGISADVTQPGRCRELVDEAIDAMGGLDALVFSTAVSPLAPLEEIDAQTWQDVIATNAIAPALVAQAAVDHLSDDGVIIFISSISTAGGYDGLGGLPGEQGGPRPDRAVLAIRATRPPVRVHGRRRHDGHRVRPRLRPREGGGAVPEVAGVERDLRRTTCRPTTSGATIAQFVAMLLAHPGLTIPELTIVPTGGMMTGDAQQLMTEMALDQGFA